MKTSKKIKRMTAAGFKKLYLSMTVNALAKKLGCSRGNVLYHAKHQSITGIKKPGCVRKMEIGKRVKP